MYYLSDFNTANFARKKGSKDKKKRTLKNPLKAGLITGGLVAATPTMIGLMDKDINKLKRVPAKYKLAAAIGGLGVGGLVGLKTRQEMKNGGKYITPLQK